MAKNFVNKSSFVNKSGEMKDIFWFFPEILHVLDLLIYHRKKIVNKSGFVNKSAGKKSEDALYFINIITIKSIF